MILLWEGMAERKKMLDAAQQFHSNEIGGPRLAVVQTKPLTRYDRNY